jgi:hypothetical protein
MESLTRHVAVNVLPAGALENAQQVERFRRDARAAARLHHTNILPDFGVGEAGGTHYCVMQHIQGRRLMTSDDVRTADRYNAACYAALAGCGRGNHDEPITGAEKALPRRTNHRRGEGPSAAESPRMAARGSAVASQTTRVRHGGRTARSSRQGPFLEE